MYTEASPRRSAGHEQGSKPLNQVTTTDGEGNILSIATEAGKATVAFTRKVTFPDTYGGGEELSIYLPIDLDGVDLSDASSVEKALIEPTATLKAFTYQQLGVGFTVQNGVVVGEAQAPMPKKDSVRKGGSKGGSKPAPSSTPVDKDDLWGQLAGAKVKGDNFETQSGETVWDNRTSKRNPKAPDFKFADSGEGLWLDQAPAWFKGAGEGIEL